MTKSFGLWSLRIGWLVAAEPFVTRAREMSVHLPDGARPSRLLARRALANPDEFSRVAHERCALNADLLQSFVAEHDSLSATAFEARPFAFVSHEEEAVDGDVLAAAAEAESGLVVPGRFFDLLKGMRVSLGRPPGQVEAALEASGGAVEGLRAESCLLNSGREGPFALVR
jgi:aspartate/methionine/tyrosine aminotransferase